MTKRISKKFLQQLRKITSKRPKTIIEHIIKKGYITTEQIKELYGYEHPPRAARDVREQGIPLVTTRVKGSDGKPIAAYKFGDLTSISKDKLGGRKAFAKKFKEDLLKKQKSCCAICLEEYDSKLLQIDHKIPYEIFGDANPKNRNINDYMLVCSSCNRAKSWSCENCNNWKMTKDTSICRKCYWSSPNKYTHISLRNIRRLDIVWLGEEVKDFESVKKEAQKLLLDLPKFVKVVIKKHLNNKNSK